MIEALGLFIAGSVVMLILILVIWAKGLTSNRIKEAEEELENWTGVLDVKREIKDKLDTDLDYVNKLRDKFNDK
ncbi:hypothetical protein OAP25_02200 [Flavobacteriaceae bacterium]|nr:hypothetical protein [Flavobacteriaceae bacterium]